MEHTRDSVGAMLDRQGVVILDGGLATELERLGADLNDPLWSAKVLAEAPHLIERVHYDYFRAGADVATTATYQATFEGFARRGIGKKAAADLMSTSVGLARDARDRFMSEVADGRRPPLIAASIGCYGAWLADGSEYCGDYGLTAAKLTAFHRPRMEVLVGSDPDILACETIPCQVEAEALVRLLEDFPGYDAWMSFSCHDNGRVRHGEPLADCVAVAAQSDRVVAVGVNCTAPSFVPELLAIAKMATDKPLVIYPNSGDTWDAKKKIWIGDPDDVDFSDRAREWYDAGARLIGGCCRTNPATIRGIAESLHAWVPHPG
ncbi:MAG: homocysteine S-methyltransferase [Gemmatimonadetes bacterium]|nr:homocysteine S-methyltransferase [Gemmatimonadota bacterium]